VIAGLLVALVALALLAAASWRPAERLRLRPATRRTARLAAAALLAVSMTAALTNGDGMRWLVEWILALGLLVPPVALATTRLLSKR
jgi:ABC-type xylose transport system permease subunit